MEESRVYFCIDMKSFYASVECAERGLDPMKTNLVVADEARGRGAICLAVSPSLKKLGVKNRCRLFEVPSNIDFIIAKPRMKKYIDYCADIYELYLDFFSPEDIHVYSIDECFLDATPYLKAYDVPARTFAKKLIDLIYEKKRIPATAGIGTNLYLAKIALDITAKKSPDRIGYLNEDLFKKTLWNHLPLSDFWGISVGTIRRLKSKRILTMRDIALADPQILYDLFGINAELLIDHAYGKESCRMSDIKAYKSKAHSVSTSQILFENYPYEKAVVVVTEMILDGCQELMRRKVVTDHVGVFVGYADDAVPTTGGVVRMAEHTSVFSVILPYVKDLLDRTTYKKAPIRRLTVDFGNVIDARYEMYDMFTDVNKVEREKKTEQTVIKIKDKFGKNAMLRGLDFYPGATAQERNKLIGGHNGGE